LPGPEDTYASYDVRWSNVSNAPFRLHKRWVHEGGISTPFIIKWPSKIEQPRIIHEPAQLIDIAATCLQVASTDYPKEFNGHDITPLEGESLLPLIEGRSWSRQQPMCWEHEGNRAVRTRQWKLVAERDKPWELYDMDADRTELNNLSEKNPEKVVELDNIYNGWADRCGVEPWQQIIGADALEFGMKLDGNFSMNGKHSHIVPL
jgi:arylsulfatase